MKEENNTHTGSQFPKLSEILELNEKKEEPALNPPRVSLSADFGSPEDENTGVAVAPYQFSVKEAFTEEKESAFFTPPQNKTVSKVNNYAARSFATPGDFDINRVTFGLVPESKPEQSSKAIRCMNITVFKQTCTGLVGSPNNKIKYQKKKKQLIKHTPNKSIGMFPGSLLKSSSFSVPGQIVPIKKIEEKETLFDRCIKTARCNNSNAEIIKHKKVRQKHVVDSLLQEYWSKKECLEKKYEKLLWNLKEEEAGELKMIINESIAKKKNTGSEMLESLAKVKEYYDKTKRLIQEQQIIEQAQILSEYKDILEI